MTIKITVRGIRQTQRFLSTKNKQVKINQTIGLTKAALFIQGEVKESIAGRKAEPKSVDTGRFLNSVDISVGKQIAKVFSNLPYAGILEFGGVNRQPRRHFNNSKDRNKQKIRQIIKDQIKKNI